MLKNTHDLSGFLSVRLKQLKKLLRRHINLHGKNINYKSESVKLSLNGCDMRCDIN